MPRKIESGWELNQEEQEIVEERRLKNLARSQGWNCWITRGSKSANPYEEGSELSIWWLSGFTDAYCQYNDMREICASIHLLGDGVNPTTHFAEPKKRGRPRIHPEKPPKDPNRVKRKYTKKEKIAA
jgi:hypothetical protein